MKKQLSLLFMLCCMICAKADVYVGNLKLESGQTIQSGTEVAANIRLVSGYVSLSRDGKTLTLGNAILESLVGADPNTQQRSWIWSNEDLTVNIVGTSKITCYTGAIKSEGSLVVKGNSNGTLIVNHREEGNTQYGIICNKDLTFEDITVDIKAIDPIRCLGSTGERKLKFISSNITLSHLDVKSGFVVYGFTAIQYENCFVADPSEIDFDVNNPNDYAGFKYLEIEKSYGISVCGRLITERNKDDVLCDGSRKVQFNSGALYLYGVNLVSDKPIIESNIENLQIRIKNDNVLKCTTNNSAIISNGNIQIHKNTAWVYQEDPNKPATLNVSNASNATTPSILINNGGVQLLDCVINTDYIKCESTESNLLYMSNSELGNCYIEGFSNVQSSGPGIHDCFFKSPVKSHYDTANRVAVDADGNRSKVTIVPAIISINGIAVTNDNADDILGYGNKDVRYDFDTNTLTLNNAYIYNTESLNTIEARNDLNIKLLGNNRIEMTAGVLDGGSEPAAKYNIYVPNGALTFTGPGALEIVTDAVGSVGIKTNENKNLSFEDCTVNITSKQTCIESPYVRVYESTLNLKTEEAESAFGGDFQLYWALLVTPKTEQETKTAKEIKIKSAKFLDLYICGIQLNEGDKDDLLHDGGSVKYDKTNNELHLYSVNINCTDPYRDAIKSGIEGLKIILHGNNNIHFNGTSDTGVNPNGIHFSKSASIEGCDVFGSSDNKLTITSDNKYAMSICANANLDIKYCTIEAGEISAPYGIENNGICTFTNSNVKTPNMKFWKELKFKGCFVKYPENFKYENYQSNYWNFDGSPIEIIAGIQPGDVNRDGEISVHDMTILIDYLRSGKVPEGADLNHDKKFDLEDIKFLEKILLEK